jgi:alpha-galactosidase
MGGEMYKFNGNVPNTSLVTNLPQGACVEVPVLVDMAGFHPFTSACCRRSVPC